MGVPVRRLRLDLPLAVFVTGGSLFAAQFAQLNVDTFGTYGGHRGGPPWLEQSASTPPLVWYAYPLAALVGLGIAARRLWPRSAFVLAALGCTGCLALGFPPVPVVFGPALGLLALATLEPVRLWAPWTVLLAAVGLAGFPRATGALDPAPWQVLTTTVTVSVIAVALALLWRIRRETARRERDAELSASLYTERLRIAREVHDGVGHSLSVIAMQAGVALHVLQSRPDQVEASLRAIRDTSREALAELRTAIGVFRDPAADSRRDPIPGLGALDDLVAGLRAAGCRVAVEWDGSASRDGADGPPLPQAVDHAAYRIVQEALTNATRHAPGAPVVVRIGRDGTDLLLEVRDSGPLVAGVPDLGHGIAGMGERARAVGGTVVAAPDPGGGFVVSVRLPAGVVAQPVP